MDILKDKITVAEVARQHDLTVSEVEGWIDEAQRNMENEVWARPKDIREQYESDLPETKEALSEAHLQIYALKSGVTCSTRTENAQGRCRRKWPKRAAWYHLPNCAAGWDSLGEEYYRPTARPRVVNTKLTARVKLTLERFPSYGYRRLACVLGKNRKPVRKRSGITACR